MKKTILRLLKEAGCPEDLVGVADDLMRGKSQMIDLQSPDGRFVVRWTGETFYYFDAGEWGYQRVQVEPDINFVDWEVHVI